MPAAATADAVIDGKSPEAGWVFTMTDQDRTRAIMGKPLILTGIQVARKSGHMRMHSSSRKAFTLVEIMIVVAIIALLAAIAVPGFVRSRKRSQAAKILNDLRLIDSAVDQYAIETSKKSGDPVGVTDWSNYLRRTRICS
jgi:prepilin-type N-terminal cleavage/methylation domain-containing protein